MTGSCPITRRAAIAGAVGAALSAPMIDRGASNENIQAMPGGDRLLAQVWG